MVDLLPNARQQFLDVNQSPLVGGKVYMYLPNTTLPKTTWADQAQTIPNPNPITLDAVGSASIWGQGLYRQVVTDSLGNVIWDGQTNPPGELNATGTNAGCIVWFPVDTPPNGFLECNGSAVSRVTYNLLFAAIGTAWGGGDGSTTFNIPDLRGYFIRGWADTGTIDSGRVFGSTQVDATNQANLTSTAGTLAVSGNVTGTLTLPGNPGAGTGAESGGQTIGKDGTYTVTVAGGALTLAGTVSGAPGITAQTETRPVNVALLPCISTGQGPGNTNGGAVILGVTEINHGDSPYTLAVTDSLVLVDCSGGSVVINPPATPPGAIAGSLVYVKDVTGYCSLATTITLNFPVDDLSTAVINSPYGETLVVNLGSTSWTQLAQLQQEGTVASGNPAYFVGDNYLAALTGVPFIPTTPVGNAVSTLGSLVLQSNFASATEREFMTILGMNCNIGGSASTPANNKVTLYVSVNAEDGAGDVWSMNTLLNMSAGSPTYHYNATGYELDFNNSLEDRGATKGSGGYAEPIAYGLNIAGGGGHYSTAALVVEGNNAWFRGIAITGQIGYYGIEDISSVPVAYHLTGNYNYGIDALAGTFSNAVLRLPNTIPIVARNSGNTADLGCLASSNGFLQLGDTGGGHTGIVGYATLVPSNTNTFSLGQAANQWTQGWFSQEILITNPTPPATATATGVKGTVVWDTNYLYVCVATNTWKRSPLSTW